jgi:hypothetical protein
MVAGAVTALAVVAIADSLRSSGELAPPEQAAPAASLRGVLVIADARCRTEAIRLPALAPEAPPRQPDCGGVTLSIDGTLAAQCREDVTAVKSPDGRLLAADVDGCAPAWRSDGALSVVRDGAIVIAGRHGPNRVFFSRGELANALRTLVERPETYSFAEVRWLSRSSFVALVRGERPWETAAAVFGPGGLESFFPQFGGHIEDLRVSPRGDFAFARTEPGRQYVMVSHGGTEMTIPRIANARALAWSPDQRWVAIASRNTTFIARVGSTEVVAQVPVGARALEWVP